MTTTTVYNEPRFADSCATTINDLVREGYTLVNGQRIFTGYNQAPASSWGTGSVSVRVVTKSGFGFRDLWIKPDQTVTLEK